MFGASYGLEVPLWFAPKGARAEEEVTYRRSNAHGPVAAEVRGVRTGVGLMDTTSYSRFEVAGPGARAWLARVFAGRIPAPGRIALNPMLNAQGRIIGDFTIACAADERYVLFGSGVAEDYHLRWWERQSPPSTVSIRSLRRDWTGLAIAGPRSRELLARLVRDDISNTALPFLSFAKLDVGRVTAQVARLSFTGELGYELWVPSDLQLALFDLLREAGADLGLTLFGSRALHSMRLEKAWGNWARDYRPIYGPCEAGLDRFLDFGKGEFVGRAAAIAERDAGPKRRLVAFEVDDAGVDASGDEPVWHAGAVVGWVTSGGYGHHVGRSLALGYVPGALAAAASGFEIEVLGERRPARILAQPLHDPRGVRMRG